MAPFDFQFVRVYRDRLDGVVRVYRSQPSWVWKLALGAAVVVFVLPLMLLVLAAVFAFAFVLLVAGIAYRLATFIGGFFPRSRNTLPQTDPLRRNVRVVEDRGQ